MGAGGVGVGRKAEVGRRACAVGEVDEGAGASVAEAEEVAASGCAGTCAGMSARGIYTVEKEEGRGGDES